MSVELSEVEIEYRRRIDAMTPQERVARSLAMFQWMRDMIARQIDKEQAEAGKPLSPEQLKWHVALRLYGNEPIAPLIRQRLEDVSA